MTFSPRWRSAASRRPFFITGSRVSAYPGVLDAIVAGGHQLANHTHNHKNLNTLTAQQVSDEINATRDLLVEAGGDQTYYVRAPYGNANKTVKSVVNAPLIYWSVDPEDWKYRNADTVYANIVNNSYDGCIILCHDVYKTTVDGALRAIDELQSQGYEFVTVEQLLTRRGITPENGVVYYDAKNNGINLPAGVSGSGILRRIEAFRALGLRCTDLLPRPRLSGARRGWKRSPESQDHTWGFHCLPWPLLRHLQELPPPERRRAERRFFG